MMGAEEFLIVNEESLHDADGPHEVQAELVPEYGLIAKHDAAQLRRLAERLTQNFDGHYVVISQTRYQELKDS